MPGPQAVVVMGVSGSGKSAVGEALAASLGGIFIDGDSLHSAQAVARMRAGVALDDTDRWPWLDRIGAALRNSPSSAVVACSALRRSYRDRLREACPGMRFVFLDGDAALIERRMQARQGHYMPASLLQSQLRTLERPAADEADVERIDIDQALTTVIMMACSVLGVDPGPDSNETTRRS